LRGIGLTVATVTVAHPVSAGHTDDDSPVSGVMDSGNTMFAAISGSVGRIKHSVFGSENPRTPTESATEVTDYFNNNSADFVAYANENVEDSTDKTAYDVIEITFEKNSDSAVRYLVADVVDGTYDTASMVESTSRSVDHTITISNNNGMVDDMPELVEEFHTEHVQSDGDVPRSWAAKKAARYGIGDDGDFQTSIDLPSGGGSE